MDRHEERKDGGPAKQEDERIEGRRGMPKWSRRGSREITPGATSLGGKYRIRSNEYPRDVEPSREDNTSCETQRRILAMKECILKKRSAQCTHYEEIQSTLLDICKIIPVF